MFSRGHRRVAFLGGTEHEAATVRRLAGFFAAADAAGVPRSELTVEFGHYDISSGYELTRESVRRARPTAIVAGNDRMALGAFFALAEAGISVPDDMSVVGYDDQPDLAAELRPALSTVALPHYEMGIRAGSLLAAGTVAPSTGETLLDCPLVERASVSVPR
ncbi:hypothetical protein GCM10025867_07810 [Frondihabitans sucicola]|uniref:Transcriptional regulator LacI/GalR-like sensor domain-containing protein n=1 Tax=Frondihabitans sucicola TaxID=1268041 RepID=A0ABN6XY15_9MICO|nr:hypothetical protein GCM10025867_07810 [Frondihabitans sucicola]